MRNMLRGRYLDSTWSRIPPDHRAACEQAPVVGPPGPDGPVSSSEYARGAASWTPLGVSGHNGATAFEMDDDGNLVLVEVMDPVTGEETLEPVVIIGPSNSLGVEAVAGAKACDE